MESMFRAHYGRLVRALTVAGGDPEIAADAVQEAFVKAHLHWRRIRHYDDPVGWIRRVADQPFARRSSPAGAQRQGTSDGSPASPNPRKSTSAASTPISRPPSTSCPRQQRIAMALFYVDS